MLPGNEVSETQSEKRLKPSGSRCETVPAIPWKAFATMIPADSPA